MKVWWVTCLLIFFFSHVYSQVNVETLKNYSDIKSFFLPHETIFLGEKDHYDENALKAKVELVKYLHDSLNFDVIAFESSLYDVHIANQMLNEGVDGQDILLSCIFKIWHSSDAIKELGNYLNQCRERGDTLYLAGFDSQLCSGNYCTQITDDLKRFLTNNYIDVPDRYLEQLHKNISEGFASDNYTLTEDFDTSFFFLTEELIVKLDSLDSRNSLFWKQNLISISGQFYDHYYNKIYKKDESYYLPSDGNFRDSLMAENLCYLKHSIQKKMIVWGATYHLVKDLSSVKPIDTTLNLESAKTMGMYLSQKGVDALVVAFVDKKVRDSKLDSLCFLEEIDLKLKEEKGFVNFQSKDVKYDTLCSYLLGKSSGMPFKSSWSKSIDALFILNPQGDIVLRGKVVDHTTLLPIPFAHVKLKGSSVGGVTGLEGEFSIQIPSSNDDSESVLEISSVGYLMEEIHCNSESGLYEISLQPSEFMLDELNVYSNDKIEKELLNNLVQEHVDNACKEPVSFDAYYSCIQQDSINTPFKNEAILTIYRGNGYESNVISSIISKRCDHGNIPILPWPIAVFDMSDFVKGQRLLSKKYFKKVVIDSIRELSLNEKKYTKIFYHRSGKDHIYEGEVLFHEKDGIYKHTVKINSNKNFHLREGRKRIVRLSIQYKNQQDYNFPVFMEHDYYSYAFYRTENTWIPKVAMKSCMKILNINLQSPEKPNSKIILLDKAPCKEEVWKLYENLEIPYVGIEDTYK